ncbi:MAG: SDR family NAD(P)-dependent oxidoreductase [Gammaproteobacteria bacterium]|nr:SDR family NAD(P)-dependent oxidoreductase [Gammaproteobacteria bacterium]
MHLNDRVAVVTGGASGLGAAVAQRLVHGGARVAIFDRDKGAGPAMATRLGDKALFIEADVTDALGIERAVQATLDAFGAIHVLVNCAGVGSFTPTFTQTGPLPLEEFRRVIDINLTGTFNVVRVVAYAMTRNAPDEVTGERGVIVNTASIAGYEGQEGMASYAASKAGIIGLNLPLTRDLSRHAIRVNAIAAGLFDTPLTADMPPEFRDYLVSTLEFPKRGGQPDEFAALVQHMVENVYINGAVFRIDAGTRAPPR